MNILKYKYKAHKLVNTLFYVAVFVIGFILGFGTNKIDFNKLISQVLMIDNVKAYTIYENDNVVIDEDFIKEMFENSVYYEDGYGSGTPVYGYNLNFDDVNNVYCRFSNSTTFRCSYYSQETIDSLTLFKSYSKYITLQNSPPIAHYFITYYDITNNTFKKGIYSFSSSSTISFEFYFEGYSNFNIPHFNSSQNSKVNVLDFSPNLEYNENLFKDNPDFKEVCVSNYDTFSITSNSVDGYDENEQPYYHSFDFMWFPNGMKGISTYRYDTEEENHVYIFEESETTFSGWWYWLNTKEEIDLYFGRDNPGLYLELRGYTDKYKYYNYTMYPFEMAFTPSYHYYPVFWFKDPYIEYLDGTKKDDSDKYCFYIKNEYDVNILNHDSMGDVYGDVTILGGTISSDSTSKNLKDMDNSTLVNTLYNLLNRLKNTINFINYHIESLFFSMPLLFQMFIVSVLLIFAIKLIINMIIK